jgi:rhodanese-related sulfurtransferase
MEDFQRINQNELDQYLAQDNTVLLDVRETWEFRDFNIGGINIAPHEITEQIETLKKYATIIVACSNGTRSSIVARVLAKKLPETKILHLEEGIY